MIFRYNVVARSLANFARAIGVVGQFREEAIE
jgi:hypothetical protein